MLDVRDVSVRYGGIVAVRGISLEVREGQVATIVGSNGAGKSSLLEAICGLVEADTGEVYFDGQQINGKAAHRIARSGLILVPEGRWILPPLTVKENLVMGRVASRGRDPSGSWSLDDVYDLFPVLGNRSSQRAGSLSGGEQQMLAIGRALMSGPRMLVLDEPSLGLAPIICDQVYDILARLKDEGLTMLLVEQDARRALRLADFGYVLAQGRVVDSGSGDALASGDRVASSYLGNESTET